eukprot:s4638_g8.t2
MAAAGISKVGPSFWAEPGPFARMPPDVDEFIEVKWKPTVESGAEIEKYQIRMALRADPLEEEWIVIDEDDLKKNTKIQGEGPMSWGPKHVAPEIKQLDKGSYAYRIHGLEDGTMYYFTIRAANCVGWSGWSEVSRFMTKNSKPSKLEELTASCTARELTVSWTPPESNGVEFLRFDLIGGPNQSLVRWCQFASALLDHTEDVDKLFGPMAAGSDVQRDIMGLYSDYEQVEAIISTRELLDCLQPASTAMAFFSFDSFSTKKRSSKRAPSPSSESDSEKTKSKPIATSAEAPSTLLTAASESSAELLAVAKELSSTAELARRFILATHNEWTQTKGAAEEAPELASLQPLVDACRCGEPGQVMVTDLMFAKALDEKEEEHMKQCCLHSLERKHLLAQKNYLDLIHGSKTWVTGGLLYISSDEPKGNERMWGQKWRKIADKGSLLDDAATQKALQSFKRLLSFHEKAP